jgi:formate hydrogenlyase subunit 3/multisubunit Na+/H+ antiporter MnhD subunit
MVTGLPPSGTFLTKMLILAAGMKTYPVSSCIAIAGMTIVFIGFLRQVTAMFFGNAPEGIEAGEGSVWLIIPPAAVLAIILVLSFYIPPFLHTLINEAVLHY